jgi:hypothetical protein
VEVPQELTASIAALEQQQQQHQHVGAAGGAAWNWAPTVEEREWYAKVFAEADCDKDGLVSGDECRAVFLRSNLEKKLLRKVWELVDVRQSDHLNLAEFSAGMHLIACALKGAPLPDSLPVELHIPAAAAPSANSSVGSLASLPPVSPAPLRPSSSSPATARIPGSGGSGVSGGPAPARSPGPSSQPVGLVGAVRAAAQAQGEAAVLREQLQQTQHSLQHALQMSSENAQQLADLRNAAVQGNELLALSKQLSEMVAAQKQMLADLAREINEQRSLATKLQSEAAHVRRKIIRNTDVEGI